jgi:uncharacterized UBP type Zn finger protein
MAGCTHTQAIELVNNQGKVCAECEKTGSSWVHLRTCQTCGVTLCCDSSPNKHATAHFKETQHPVVASAEKNEYWLWCYVDQAFDRYA